MMARRRNVYELFEPLAAEGTVLDIGCGPGITVEHLARKYSQIVGVDLSIGMVKECVTLYGKMGSAHFSSGRIEELPFISECFDAVICMGVVEYIEDDYRAVNELRRVLKPGGSVIITLPNKLSPYRIWNKWVYRKVTTGLKSLLGLGRRNLLTHREYTEIGYRRLLESQGFRVSDVIYYNLRLAPHPIDRLFPGPTMLATRLMESQRRSSLRWLGTGFIVRAEAI